MTSDALRYQPATRFGISRTRVRIVIALACAIGLYGFVVTVWPKVERKLYWRRVAQECSKYEMPPMTLVYRERSSWVGAGGGSTQPGLMELVGRGGRRAEATQISTPKCFQLLRSGVPPPGQDIWLPGVVMLHERRTRSGERVIVYVSQERDKAAPGVRAMQGRRSTVPPAGIDLLLFDLSVDWPAICGPYKSFKLFAGRAHPAEPSSIVFDFECDDRAGQIVGTLQVDDSMTLTARYAGNNGGE